MLPHADCGNMNDVVFFMYTYSHLTNILEACLAKSQSIKYKCIWQDNLGQAVFLCADLQKRMAMGQVDQYLLVKSVPFKGNIVH